MDLDLETFSRRCSTPDSTPVNLSRITGWGILLFSSAMVVALALEGARASVQEDWRHGLPASAGFALAGVTAVWSKHYSMWVAEWAQKRFSILILLVVPLAIQMVLILVVRSQQLSDWAGYWGAAQRLYATGEYSYPMQEGGDFRAFKPPGVAIYLATIYAFFGNSVLAAQMANAVVLSIGTLLFYLIVNRRWGREPAVVATTLFALWPSRNFCVLLLGYDPPGALAVLVFWLLADPPKPVRWSRNLLAGLAAGVAVMLRQTLLLLPFTFILYRLLTQSDGRLVLRRGLALLTGLSLVVGAWAVRNYCVLGQPVITCTQGGPSLYRSFHPLAGRYYTNIGWQELLRESGGDELKLNETAWHRGIDFILSDPRAAVVRVLSKWQRLLESDHEIAGWALEAPGGPLPPRLYSRARQAACGLCDVWYAWMALTTLLASYAALRSGNLPIDLLWPLLAFASAVVAHGVFESQPRYLLLYQCFWAVLAAHVWRTVYLTAKRQEV